MGRNILMAGLVLAGGVLGLLGVGATNLFRDASSSDQQLRDRGALVLPQPREIAPFQLRAHDGSPFTHADLEGHWTLALFGYTFCPDICPITMAALARARKALVAQSSLEIAVVMVSVDPERDTPQRLARYVAQFSPDFVGVTGTPSALSAFAAELHVGVSKVPNEEPGSHLVDHSAHIMVLNPHGQYHAILKAPHHGDNIAAMVGAIVRDF